MITLHHLEKSQSIRILWLLEELGVPYEVKLYDRDPNTRLAPAEYKAVSPLGTAPCITDGDITLSETNAIMDHILDRHDDGRLVSYVCLTISDLPITCSGFMSRREACSLC